MSQQPSVLQRLWFKWKALPLPWRRRVLAGHDLAGNTYWEFRIAGMAKGARPRRMVCYPRLTQYSDVKVPPLWHQWLRYTRPDAPTMQEQVLEQRRQERMRVLAAQADARWEAKPRIGEDEASARSRITGEQLKRKAAEVESVGRGAAGRETTVAAAPDARRDGGAKGGEPGPWGKWERAQETKEQWQPTAWSPTPKQKA